jgi:hypothetical protein
MPPSLGMQWLDELRADLRLTSRTLRQHPGFAAVVILSLALGIGANTAIFGLVDAVVLRMLPVHQPDRLMFVHVAGTEGPNDGPPYPCFELFRDTLKSLEGLSAFSASNMELLIHRTRLRFVAVNQKHCHRSRCDAAEWLEKHQRKPPRAEPGPRTDDPASRAFHGAAGRRRSFHPEPAATSIRRPRFRSRRHSHVGSCAGKIPQSVDRINRLALAVRTAGDAMALAAPVRRELRRVASSLLITNVSTIEKQVQLSLMKGRLVSTLSVAFGALALVLVCIGLYGLLAYAVARRTNEIGIRMALGAARQGMVWFVLKEALILAACGIVIGTPVSLFLGGMTKALLYGVEPFDVRALTMTASLLFAFAVLAAAVPARSASRLDPMAALRID